jgi:hypothetical protein
MFLRNVDIHLCQPRTRESEVEPGEQLRRKSVYGMWR